MTFFFAHHTGRSSLLQHLHNNVQQICSNNSNICSKQFECSWAWVSCSFLFGRASTCLNCFFVVNCLPARHCRHPLFVAQKVRVKGALPAPSHLQIYLKGPVCLAMWGKGGDWSSWGKGSKGGASSYGKASTATPAQAGPYSRTVWRTPFSMEDMHRTWSTEEIYSKRLHIDELGDMLYMHGYLSGIRLRKTKAMCSKPLDCNNISDVPHHGHEGGEKSTCSTSAGSIISPKYSEISDCLQWMHRWCGYSSKVAILHEVS